MNDFEKQVIEMLAKVLEKQSEHDIKFNDINERFNMMGKRFDTVENKLNTVMEQTAKNTEFDTLITEKNEKLEFEIELLKKYIRS